MNQTIITRLAQHRALSSAPASEHEWLAAHGKPREFAVGEVVTAKGTQSRELVILFSGNVVIRVDRGAGAHKIFEWRGGDVGGVMPYSRGASPPNDAIAEERVESLVIAKELFGDMIHACPVVTATLVHAMIDRARQFTTADLRDEKLISLGKLAAGLAHELNNPALAVIRSAKTLTEALGRAESAARHLAMSKLTDLQFQSIERARAMCGDDDSSATLSAVARADREDSIGDWLAHHNVSEESAIPLADTGVSIAALDSLASNVSGAALEASIEWLSACCLVRSLSSEIETAAGRMHDLVSAVKGFSYMDHAPTPEPVDIRRGISDALMMLGGKMRAKSVDVELQLAENLPRAHAVGAELNQVWLNLIDNALDAVADGGRVSVSAARELDSIVVNITDNGPGIPDEIQPRIFDPFFTTKGVGKGTGLGLDIVKRLLKRHEGSISLELVPGRTVFQVRLPLGSG